MLYDELDDGAVQCHVCPRLCRIAPGKSGVCRARVNKDGKLYAITYGKVCSVAADPIEKKPLYHFFPGTTVLSLGSVGCNFTCRHCQNWQIAHADPADATRDLRDLPIRNLPVLAANNECQGVAWTYNEPTIWLEYILDGAQAAHEHGLYTVLVTNGYITEEALAVLAPHIDAYRVDVKGFSDAQYKELCRIPEMLPVLESAERAKARVRLSRRDRHQRHPDVQRRRGDPARHRLVDGRPARPGDPVARHALHALAGVRAPPADADRHARERGEDRQGRRAAVRVPRQRPRPRRREHDVPELQTAARPQDRIRG